MSCVFVFLCVRSYRSMNRAPGPSDTWYRQHQLKCGGKFIKILEPVDYGRIAIRRNNKLLNKAKHLEAQLTCKGVLRAQPQNGDHSSSSDMHQPQLYPHNNKRINRATRGVKRKISVHVVDEDKDDVHKFTKKSKRANVADVRYKKRHNHIKTANKGKGNGTSSSKQPTIDMFFQKI